MPKLIFIILLACLALLVSCLPKTAETKPMTELTQEVTSCSLELDFSEIFTQLISSVSETEAQYQIILSGTFQNLLRSTRSQLQSAGWTFQNAEEASRDATAHKSKYLCETTNQSLHLSIKPRGRSLVYDVKLTLE